MSGFFASLFQPIVKILETIVGLFYNFTQLLGVGNYGLAIILMTVVIKVLLYPLTVKQVKSMKAMQDLQPKIKELQKKYKDKPQELQQKMGQIYKEAGVNPLAGCLPLIAQMPILMAMFYALQSVHFTNDPSFLWIPNLAMPDPLYILPILSALTTFVTQWQTTKTSAQQGAQMKIMMVAMPIFIGWISIKFAAGLVLYWVVMNIMQVLQQWWMYRNEEQPTK
ncbi:YidC/Oxa1 family membrane protein insertase [Pectinatus sottacetonis]|uniref:YidC/Oxa1 family membrane protein insertase n=1 Tax=Pectinatus sottacetonis TaxID=1002795 RepID=UPI0018C5A18A|nr:YidC/Oxa1 family membrane protein insertase [Pectinatus sottacetonis]